MAILFIIGGLLALLLGADALVRGVSTIAQALGVPPIIIALTVVAFGTSTPEVVINGISAIHGQTQLAFGNIVGSCAINIGFVLALSAMIRPLNVAKSIVTRELPLLLLTVAIVIVLSADCRLNGGDINRLSRADGIVLLLLFCVFLYSIIRTAIVTRATDPLIHEVQQITTGTVIPHSWPRSIALTIMGLIGVAGGGRLAVTGAVALATAMGIPDFLIGLTIISFGTTLPELATSIVAARRGQPDIALGNVVGSNIFNLQFVGGLTATICPINLPRGGMIDLLFLGGLTLALLPISLRQSRVTRAEGALLMIAYFVYLGWRVLETGALS